MNAALTVEVLRVRGPVALRSARAVGLRDIGVPAGGFADEATGRLANRLVGQAPDATLLECALGVPDLRFSRACVIAVAGPPCGRLQSGSQSLPMWRRVRVGAGQTLRGGALSGGRFAYVAIAGAWLDAGSPWGGAPLASGTRLEVIAREVIGGAYAHPPEYLRELRRPGPLLLVGEACADAAGPINSLMRGGAGVSGTYSVSPTGDRVGVRLLPAGSPRAQVRRATPPSVVSNPVVPGVVQLTPSGALIVCGPDAGTLGGYPRLGVLDAESLSAALQAPAGARVRLALDAPPGWAVG